MKPLRRAALAHVPLTEATVESFHDGTHAGTTAQCLVALCASHERLRMELEGAGVLLEDAYRECERLRARLAAALALTDTGSPEFLAAFPPRSAGERFAPREIVPGWRVVERVREALAGG